MNRDFAEISTQHLYNSIGQDYNRTRQADARIVDRLISLLDLPVGSTIVPMSVRVREIIVMRSPRRDIE